MKPAARARRTAAVRRLIATVLLTLACAAGAFAQAPARDLGSVTLEQLMDIRITSAGRREQRPIDTAAAVYVITNEDIRRSGFTTLPDILRLAPGVQVARINGNKWAVSIRGFNALYSNKLLVLIDGRSIYNRLFSGILWDMADMLLDDIERVEVIRGPGAVSWGANAVNGVINVITKSAANTTGTLVRVNGGAPAAGLIVVRQGVTRAEGSYRLFGRVSDEGASTFASGAGAADGLRRATLGFTADWARGLSLSGAFTRGRADALYALNTAATVAADPSSMSAGSLAARWTRRRTNGSSLQLQSTFESMARDEPIGRYQRRMGDIDVQYHAARAAHDYVVGGGVRGDREEVAGHNGFSMTPSASTTTIVDLFAQDEITLSKRLRAALGGRVERDSLAGWSLQPTARLMWTATSSQRLWVAVSRAVRTPSLEDRGIRIELAVPASPFPTRIVLSGNPLLRSEGVVALEGGYRVELASSVAASISVFRSNYSSLRNAEPSAPFVSADGALTVPLRFDNLAAARTAGVEVDARWAPASWWGLDVSYAGFRLTPSIAIGSRDAAAAAFDGAAPAAQWQAHSAWTVGATKIDARLFHVGRLKNMDIAAYSRADLRVEVPIARRLSAAIAGQNLLSPGHIEFGNGEAVTVTRVPRRVHLDITWRY